MATHEEQAQAEKFIKEWNSDADLREEFRNDFGCYVAFREAEDKGLSRQMGKSKRS